MVGMVLRQAAAEEGVAGVAVMTPEEEVAEEEEEDEEEEEEDDEDDDDEEEHRPGVSESGPIDLSRPHPTESQDESEGDGGRPGALIPLSLIRARYGRAAEGMMQHKRARLEEMVTHIKKGVTSAGAPNPSGDATPDMSKPLDLNLKKRRSHLHPSYRHPEQEQEEEYRGHIEEDNNNRRKEDEDEDDDPEGKDDLGAIYHRQQQLLQLQLASAVPYAPPWLYLGYYSHLLHSFQAQELLRQLASQSQGVVGEPPSLTSDPAPAVTTASLPSPHGSISPHPTHRHHHPQHHPHPEHHSRLLTPTSDRQPSTSDDFSATDLSATGLDPGPALQHRRRAPRAMTGKHVRTGTGASPATLLTLRHKIEERQKMKALGASASRGSPGSAAVPSNRAKAKLGAARKRPK